MFSRQSLLRGILVYNFMTSGALIPCYCMFVVQNATRMLDALSLLEHIFNRPVSRTVF